MKTCPTCHRPFPAKRTCAICLRPIKLRHRWKIEGTHVRHESCIDPFLTGAAPQPLLEEVAQ
jgi:hypothetical protein